MLFLLLKTGEGFSVSRAPHIPSWLDPRGEKYPLREHFFSFCALAGWKKNVENVNDNLEESRREKDAT